MSRYPASGTPADGTAGVQPPSGLPAGTSRLIPPRCPRCGAGMGRLTADDPTDALVYCGCCGVVLAAPDR